MPSLDELMDFRLWTEMYYIGTAGEDWVCGTGDFLQIWLFPWSLDTSAAVKVVLRDGFTKTILHTAILG